MDAQHLYVAQVVGSYWLVSISMVYLNKVLMTSAPPLFITWCQCVTTVVVCFACGKVGEKGEAAPRFFRQFPSPEVSPRLLRATLPLSLTFLSMITLNNLCLTKVHVSFYNVARSLTIVFNVVLSWFVLGQRSTGKTMGCLGIVVMGFVVGTQGEPQFSLSGTLYGVSSSLFVSLNSIQTKKTLPLLQDSHWRVTLYNNVNASLLFFPLVVAWEGGELLRMFVEGEMNGAFMVMVMTSGVMGFLIGIVTVLQIKATSPLTHNISGTAKAAFQAALAHWLWGNPATFKGVVGILAVLGGSLAYTKVRMEEGRLPVTQKDSEKGAPKK